MVQLRGALHDEASGLWKGMKNVLPFVETEEEEEDKYGEFQIEPASAGLTVIPDTDDITEVDVRYPLLQPFADAHISWNDEEEELIYSVEEPTLSEREQEIFDRTKGALEKKISVPLSALETSDDVVDYLQDQVKEVLDELGYRLSESEENKLLYYVYRNFGGLNEIEALMNDPYIEDIGCSGTGIPVYIIHTKFGSIKTNLVFDDEENLRELIVKLAERADKYVSYSDPLLDGTLPDGSRVNASLTADVTTKGPTFSIRKFQEVPFSAVDLLDLGTVNKELMAYMWMCLEYQKSGLIIGGTATGKTTLLNSIVSFIPPEMKIVSIEDSVTGDTELEFKLGDITTKQPIEELVDPVIEARGEETLGGGERAEITEDDALQVATIDDTLSVSYRTPKAVYRHKTEKNIYRVETASGRQVKVTGDHSIFTLSNGNLVETEPTSLNEGDRIATPRTLSTGNAIETIDVLEAAEDRTRVFAEGGEVAAVFDDVPWTIIRDISDISEHGYKHWKRNGMMRGAELHQLRANNSIDVGENLQIRSKSHEVTFPLHLPVTAPLSELFGLWLGDGSYDRHNQNAVLITSSEESVRGRIHAAADELGIGTSVKHDGTVSLNSVLLYEVMNGIGFKGLSATKTVPDFCRDLGEERIGALLRGYFSADGAVKTHEVTCSSQSRELLVDMQDLLLRLGIVGSINDYDRDDGTTELSISSRKFLERFREKVGFIQGRKQEALETVIEQGGAHHEKSDVIPTDPAFAEEVHDQYAIQWNYRNEVNNLGRTFLQEIAEETADEDLKRLGHSDIYWDRVTAVEKVETEEEYVYDISVPGPERFIGNNVLLHNTRELQLPHQNWIPSVTRSAAGEQQDDITMYELLRESFRQNPDYVVVGEVRGEEASVLFQGMASGHPSLSTMHASTPADVVSRLTTPPIDLSPSLIETLDLIVSMTHAREWGENARRVQAVYEIEDISDEGTARTNEYLSWTAVDDSFSTKADSTVLDNIQQQFGLDEREIRKEMEDRERVLSWLHKKGYTHFEKVSSIVSEYYKDKETVMQMISDDTSLGFEDVVSETEEEMPPQVERSREEMEQAAARGPMAEPGGEESPVPEEPAAAQAGPSPPEPSQESAEDAGGGMDYDALVQNPVETVKDRVERQGIDPERALQAEKAGQNRPDMVRWLRGKTERRDMDGEEEEHETEEAASGDIFEEEEGQVAENPFE